MINYEKFKELKIGNVSYLKMLKLKMWLEDNVLNEKER